MGFSGVLAVGIIVRLDVLSGITLGRPWWERPRVKGVGVESTRGFGILVGLGMSEQMSLVGRSG